MSKKIIQIIIILLFILKNNIVLAESSRLEGIIEAFREALVTGQTIDHEGFAETFGYKNFDEFAKEYLKVHELKNVTVDEVREFLEGTDKSVIIDQSQENLDKLYSLIMNDKYFKKKTTYFKRWKKGKVDGNIISEMALAAYVNYEKEMAKITKNPNLKKISRFSWDWGYTWGTGYKPYPYALEGCEKDAKKYKLIGGECVIVDWRSKTTGEIKNMLKPSIKLTKRMEELKKQKTKPKKTFVQEIAKLKKLYDEGIITKDEFSKAKKQVIGIKTKKINTETKKRKKASSKEIITIPISVKIVQINQGKYKTTSKKKDILNYFKKVNKIWSQTNIRFNVIEVEKTPSNTEKFKKNVAYIDKHFNSQLNEYKKATDQTYKKSKAERYQRRLKILHKLINAEKYQSHSALNVYYIPKMLNKYSCGMARSYSLFGHSHGVVSEGKIKGYAVIGQQMPPGCKMSIVLAHEIGHMMSLGHGGATGLDLMMWGNGTNISEAVEIEARKFYKSKLGPILN